MQTTTAKKSISSATLIRLINDCRERQAHASGVSFPSQTFPCVDQAEITKKAQELLGVTPKASSHLFSQRQAHSLSSIYGPTVQAALVDFFEQQAAEPKAVAAVAKKKQTAQFAQHHGVPAMEIGLSSGGDDAPMTMSSREIAELTGKEHKNVIRDIRTMLDALEKDGSDLSHVREDKDTRGYTTAFHLDRELTDTLLTGYNIPMRRKVIARWHQLEAEKAHTAPHVQMPTQMSQMLSMLSEGYGKIECELQRLNREVEYLKANSSPLQRPAPKLRTKDPARIPGPQGWQTAKTIDSIRMSFSIGPHEIGLERFYLYLHGLDSDLARREALRQALHFGIQLDASMPENFPENPRTITFKFSISENDVGLKNVLEMLLALPDDKQRRAAIKRHLVAKSQQAVNVSVALVQQPALF